MRVVQVTAHYPPNFTSGGTLVPQRIARGLAGRGHESWVYAGHLDKTRPPLSTWEEADASGVRVRWVSTTPWTAWDDDRNWSNPAVEADFRGWLAEVRPDVVHLHSLQTLGGSLVRAAKDSGAATVVTMHDFWWFCARQFLVDRAMRPCSLVVDCGVCECQVDQEWKVARLRRLAEDLKAADVVLAPSRSAARVLVANGVDPRRLRVDENGVPVSGATSPDAGEGDAGEPGATDPGAEIAASGSGARLMFAGGMDPMKGWPVLAEALARLPQDMPWTIDLYGVPLPGRHLPSRVRGHEAFVPGQLTSILGAHDVLVLPSVMRESHSILTREALAAGLAVVCTDTLGPEEAVDHGRNGLVVPAGDAASLAASLERLVRHPDLLAAMRGQGSASPLRPVADQVDGLERLYHELTADRPAVRSADSPAAGDGAGPIRQVLFVVGINGAPLRYRVHLAAEALVADGASAEVRHYRDPDLPALARAADAIVLYRVPATVQIVELIEAVRRRNTSVPILFDVDDLIFDPGLRGEVGGLGDLSAEAEELWWRGVARYRTTMELADVYVGSTRTLCDHAAAVTGLPVRQFRNGVGRAVVAGSERALAATRRHGPLRIGYFSGTTTHNEDWAMIEPAVIEVMLDRPDVRLWIGGYLRTSRALDVVRPRVRKLSMMPWQDLQRTLRDVDVNLAPLVPDSVFNEAKSAIKWLEAAMVETPTVASPTQPFVEAIEHGRTGYLAVSGQEWVDALGRLLDDDAERARVGAQARREALLTLSPHVQGRVYREILRDGAAIAAAGGPARVSTWIPAIEDEPFSAADAWVEPYAERRARRRVPLARELAAVWRVLRAAGVSGVATKVREKFGRGTARMRDGTD